MNSERASTLSNYLYEAAELLELDQRPFRGGRQAAAEFLSDKATAGVASVDSRPVILAFDGRCLVVLEAPPESDGSEFVASVFPVALIRQLSVNSERVNRGRGGGIDRVWTVERDGQEPLVVQTHEPFSNSLHEDFGGSGVMGAVAHEFGWPLPL